ncbi:MAG: DUF805 domain-containing protein [Candidatus Gracilibacteria bacterium]|nr:DUF805 domain-containing protein [Candidatus Gracilibacteria bacterium]
MKKYIQELFSLKARYNRKKFLIKKITLVGFYLLILIALAIPYALIDVVNSIQIGPVPPLVGTILLGIKEILKLVAIFSIFIILMGSIFIDVKRLRDLNKSHWLIILGFVPVINLLFFIYIIFFKGTIGPNKYGPDPLEKIIPTN